MSDLSEIFSGAGALSRAVSDYRPRDTQRQMAEAVAEAISTSDRILLEAGTGTGKTFAYLVPALLSGSRVIVSTGTKNLQDQLFKKDLPAVSRALGRPVAIAILKGRANYYCRHRAAMPPDLNPKALRDWQRISEWARSSDSGDVGEVTGVPETSTAWPQVTSTVENCVGQDCPEYSRCFVVKARRQAMDADLVIVNHHLLLADMALKEEGFGELLPGADAVVVDEAHQLPDIAGRFFGVSISARQLEFLARDLRAELLAAVIRDDRVEQLLDRVPARAADVRLTLQRGRSDYDKCGKETLTTLAELRELLVDLAERFVEPLLEISDPPPGLAQAVRRLQTVIERFDEFESGASKGVRWLETSPRGFTMNLTPYDVSENLGRFFNDLDCAWIFTSATLAVGEDFSHIGQRLGLDDAQSFRFESTFDYQSNTLIYMPKNLPEPQQANYTAQVLDAVMPLIERCRGGVFMLMTSHRALREMEALVAERWGEENERPVLVQGQHPRHRLLEEFRRHGDALLIGTASFWEGVDVRGPALSLVIIDKLPFASPGEPLTQARIKSIHDEGGNPFFEHQLPQAVLALKQGVGRLVRSETDRGLVVLCDPRLNTKSYGKLFLSSLPPMRVTHESAEALAFLDQIGGDAAQ